VIVEDLKNIDLHLRAEQVEKLFHRWEKLERYLFDAIKKADWTTYFDDKFPEEFQKLELEFSISKEALALDPSAIENVMKLFSNRNANADTRIRFTYTRDNQCQS
jgi:uncharacterized protein (DUF1786 family)